MSPAVEACFLIGAGPSVLWAERSSSPVALPDSAHRWQQIWRHRARLIEITHTHPHGPLGFSSEDESTIVAITAALGRSPWFGVVTPRGYIRNKAGLTPRPVQNEPWWVPVLRTYSGLAPTDEEN